MFAEWTYLPQVFVDFITNPVAIGLLLLGVVAGYLVGVIPGMGPSMVIALSLSALITLKDPMAALALLIGALTAGIGSGGITASLTNIPGTPAAAATCMDGYALVKQGQGRRAVGLSISSSVTGSIIASIFIFFLMPFVNAIALMFGDWEVFLFCLFGVMICGSLSGKEPLKGWLTGMIGLLLAMVGSDSLQSVQRFTFGLPALAGGFDTVVALIGMFGVGEAIIVLKDKVTVKINAKAEQPIYDFKYLLKSWKNVARSTLAGVWVGFIPGVGESAACWFSYDIAKRASKEKEKFGKGSAEGIVAAEIANNACTVGALIPALSLGIPGSPTTGMFLAALFLLGYRPGPTLMTDAPGILCSICMLFILSAIAFAVFSKLVSKYVIYLLGVSRTYLMPIIIVFCVIGAWATTYKTSCLWMLLGFGILGAFLKLFNYPIPPLILGLLIGNIADRGFRTTMMQYANNPLGIFQRPIGVAVMIALVVLFFFGLKTNKKAEDVESDMELKSEAEE